MPANLEARVASLRKARSDQAVDSCRSTFRSNPVRQPYSSWLEKDGERVEAWLAEQKHDAQRRQAAIEEQSALAFIGVVRRTPNRAEGEGKADARPDNFSGRRDETEPKTGIKRRWTTGETRAEEDILTGVGAFAGEEAQWYGKTLDLYRCQC